jgi:eukaryotic-like serine/threonine-protein kinase
MSHDSLDAVIAAYMLAVEAGEVPNRQELLDQHSEHADALRAFFVDLDRMDRVAAPLRIADGPEATGAVEANGHSALPTVRYFGDYELLEEIARGGMGIVYKARQASLNRLVALKMILAGSFASSRDIQRFRTEAEAAANLDHPHIVPIYEVGEHEGQQYYSMKFVEGTSLAKHSQSDPRKEVEGMVTVIRAVHHAHQRGVLHRDLKPSNVLVDSTETRLVTDFGLAKRLAASEGSLTESGQVLGTPKYMAPEQADGRKDLTVAVDVYSLGVILYERLTGQTPFTGDNALTLLRQARESEPPRPSTIRAGLDRNLETAVLKCLVKEPGRRYPSAEALADDLDRWLRSEPIQARPVGQVERLAFWCRRNPVIASLTAAVAASLIIGIIASTFFAFKERRERSRADLLAAAAQEESTRAIQATRKALDEKDRSDRLRYVAEINAAVRDYQAGKLERVRTRLTNLIPRGRDEIDLRGIEWYHLQWLINPSLKILTRHRSGGSPFAFSPDGRRLVVGTGSEVYEWDTVEEKQLAELKITGGIELVAYGPDGVVLVNHAPWGEVKPEEGDNGTILVRLWEPKSGRDKVIVHTNAGHSAVLSHDGRRAALIAGNRAVKVLKLDTGRVVATLQGDLGHCSGYALSPSGSHFAFVNNDNLCVWDTESSPVATIDRISPIIQGESSLTGKSWTSRISSDGRLVVMWERGVDSNIRIWDLVTRRVKVQLSGSAIPLTTVEFSLDNRRIAAGCRDGILRIWDVDTGQQLSTLRGHEGNIDSVVFSPDGRRVASGGDDGTVRIWDTETYFSPIAFQGSDHEGFLGINNLVLHPDGRRVVLPKRIMDLESGRLLARIPTVEGDDHLATRVSVSPDGRLMATAHSKIWLQELATGREIAELQPPKEDILINDIAFSPDGRLLASASSAKVVRLWDVRDGHEVAQLGGHEERICDIDFSPDGRRLASASGDGTVRIWDLSTSRTILVLRGKEQGGIPFYCVSYSPDGRLLAAGSHGGSIHLWDATSGLDSNELLGHRSWVCGLRFSPEGRRLVSTSTDGSVLVWDVATRQELIDLALGKSITNGDDAPEAVFSRDGARLVGFDNRYWYVWDGTPPSREALLQRESLGVIRFHLKRASSEKDFLDRIIHDQTILESVRSASIMLAAGQWEGESAVRETARKDAVRWKAQERANKLLADCWRVVKLPGRNLSSYLTALRNAEEALRLAPDYSEILSAVGVAQYRSGRYQDALATLRDHADHSSTVNLAFLAMVQQRLGQCDAARGTLNRLIEVIKQSGAWATEEDEDFLREAESVLFDAGFPADPIAH